MFGDKKFYFLSGVPRSGNTLLGSILNQNKDISVSSNSIVSEMLYRVDLCENEDRSKNFYDPKSHYNVCKNIIPNYYSNWKCKVIIDRSPWGTLDNLRLLKKYSPNEIKIIVLLRDIEEVLASFIKWSKENPGNFLDNYATIEEKCDYLIQSHGMIHHSLGSVHNLLKEENRKYALFLTYDDLVFKTPEVVEKIYKFLKIKPYKHNFNKVGQFKANNVVYDDSIHGNNLHKVKENGITKSQYSPEDYIPRKVLEKYSVFNFWKKMDIE